MWFIKARECLHEAAPQNPLDRHARSNNYRIEGGARVTGLVVSSYLKATTVAVLASQRCKIGTKPVVLSKAMNALSMGIAQPKSKTVALLPDVPLSAAKTMVSHSIKVRGGVGGDGALRRSIHTKARVLLHLLVINRWRG